MIFLSQQEWSLVRRTLSYLFRYHLAFIGMAVCMLMVALLEPLLPLIIKPFLDSVDGIDFFIKPQYIPYLLLAIILFLNIFSYGRSYLGGLLCVNVERDIRNDMAEHFLKLPISYTQEETLGATTSRFMSFVPSLTSSILPVATALIQESAKVIFYIGWMFYLQWNLALIILLILPFVVLLIHRLGKSMKKATIRSQEEISNNQNQLNEAVSLLPVIKISNIGGATNRLKNAFSSLRNISLRQKVIIAMGQPLSQILMFIPSTVVLIIIVNALISKQMTPGSVVAFLSIMFLMPRSVRTITRSISNYKAMQVAAKEIFSFLDIPVEKDSGKKEAGKLLGDIVYENIHFSYTHDSKSAIHNISLSLPAKKTIAFVGRSGAGKTTLAKMIPRFYLPNEGTIRIDGEEIGNFTLASLRNNIAIVTQEPLLFDDTVAYNISYPDNPQENMQKIQESLLSAEAENFVHQLPKGIETPVGFNGSKLSGGQCQRLSLARAFYKNASIVILDEATSALDSETQSKIKESMRHLFSDKTAIIITHRFSLIDLADMIVVLDEGKVVATGTEEELRENCPLFQELSKVS